MEKIQKREGARDRYMKTKKKRGLKGFIIPVVFVVASDCRVVEV